MQMTALAQRSAASFARLFEFTRRRPKGAVECFWSNLRVIERCATSRYLKAETRPTLQRVTSFSLTGRAVGVWRGVLGSSPVFGAPLLPHSRLLLSADGWSHRDCRARNAKPSPTPYRSYERHVFPVAVVDEAIPCGFLRMDWPRSQREITRAVNNKMQVHSSDNANWDPIIRFTYHFVCFFFLPFISFPHF